jgi:SAM-dependent methyltransferase
MKKEEFECPVCNTIGKWKNVDQFRTKPEGMCICETCGFISYPERFKTEEQIKKFYRDEYRSIPQGGNLISGNRKLQYHEFFLGPLFEEWRMQEIDKPVVGEIGSALGMFLNWIKGKFPQAEIHGTELTTGFKKVAFYEYGIKLEDDFDYTKKYDLITSYHVLEHQMRPDIKLKEYAACLKDNGVFYLAVPVWFQALHTDATASFDLDYYWHPDHFNAWGENHLEWIIAKAGLEPIYKNDTIYGTTYILKKSTKKVEQPKWSFDNSIKFVETAQKVWLYIQEQKSKAALELYKNCVTAWVHNYEYNRAWFDKHQPELWHYLDQCIEACPNSADACIFAADVCTRYERLNHAKQYYQMALNKKPNSAAVVMGLSNIARLMALKETNQAVREEHIKSSLDALRFIRNTAPDMQDKAISWMFHDMNLLNLPEGKNEKINLSPGNVTIGQ